MVKVNLGSGQDYRPGFVNIDALKENHPDVVADITLGLPLENSSVDFILAQDVLEHLTYQQQTFILAEITRVLKTDGLVEVRLPNIDDIIERFAADPQVRNLFLYGDTSKTGAWGAHKSGHTLQSFAVLAKLEGLDVISWQKQNTNFVINFRKSQKRIQIRKLCFVNQSLDLGGAETFNHDLLEWLVSQGIQVTAIVSHPKFQNQLQALGIFSYRLPVIIDVIGDLKGLVKGLILLPLGIVYYAWQAYKNRDQLFLMSGYIEKILVTPWAKLFGSPVVWLEFAPLSGIASKFWGLPRFLYSLVKSFPDLVIVPSQNTFRHLIKDEKLSQARMKMIPLGRNIKVSQHPPSGKNVCCVSRLESGKGQDELIKAWPGVVAKVPEARLRIIGEGAMLPKLKQLAEKLNVSESIYFLGRISDEKLDLERKDSTVCVFPTLWNLEGFGMVAIEAMAAARPVVAFEFGPVPEIVSNKEGILVPAKDTAKLAEAIVRLLINSSLAQKMGQAGRTKFHQKFAMKKVGPCYLEAFNQALAIKDCKL